MKRAWCGVLWLSCAACRDAPASVFLALDVASESGVKLEELEVAPAAARRSLRVEGGRGVLELSRASGKVTLSAPFACPLELDPSSLGSSERRSLSGLFDFGPATRVVGFAREFEVRAEPRCEAARHATVTVAVAGGDALERAEQLEDGRVFRGRTAAPGALLSSAPRGLVPVSARERGATKLRAEVTLAGGRTLVRTLEIAAATRASGLANVAVEHEVLIRGDRVELVEAPAGSRATLVRYADGAGLVPDVSGRYVLSDGALSYALATGRYDETPLDCGRAECHRRESEGAATTPMTHALERRLDGTRSAPDAACTLACHATGEPGRADGGFSHVLAEFGVELPRTFAELPRALGRLGGAGCLGCHGPGAVPEPHTRFAVLGRGVCAVCHDAPPRYGHVAAFEASNMARSDRDASTRRAECARCHTSAGALARPALAPPDHVTLGLGCAVCHDPHPDAGTARPALLRDFPLPATIPNQPRAAGGTSRVCLACHAPSSVEVAPEASAAVLWAGSGGVEPSSGEALSGSAVHAVEPRGCLACHDTPEPGLTRGASHGFRAARSRCTPCHASPPSAAPELRARAAALRERLETRLHTPLLSRSAAPPHATRTPLPSSPLGRALYDVLLVLEDAAADVHNPAYARLLLDRAEAALAPDFKARTEGPP